MASERIQGMDIDDYTSPGLEATITLTPRETTALATISSGRALFVLHTYYRRANRGRRDIDSLDSMRGWRQEFEDAIAALQGLGDRLSVDQIDLENLLLARSSCLPK